MRGKPAPGDAAYTARDIEVLEGLEPVRRRPGMYIGGTDEKALHHLFAEVIDNAMDEALAGHADWIDVSMAADGFVTVVDNGRGMPVDPHPKFPKKSALEVIMCTLHAGGKFNSKVYETSGGLHGVGVSVTNALSERVEVEVARGGKLYAMAFERGIPQGKLKEMGRTPNRRGTSVRFKPDPKIFGAKAAFKPARIFKMARSKAYLFGGVEIRWSCDKALLAGVDDVPEKETFHFERGLTDFLTAALHGTTLDPSRHLRRQGRQDRQPRRGRMGGRLGRGRGRVRLLLLQHDPDAGRRHARGGPARRAHPRHARSRRARRQGKRAAQHHAGRRDDRRGLHALGVHPRAGIPGPDQGPPRHRRGAAPHRSRRSRTTSITGSRAIPIRRTSCSTG